jgi:hypothetical protein
MVQSVTASNTLLSSKSPVSYNWAFCYFKEVVSDPWDLALGFLVTTYLTKSVSDLTADPPPYRKYSIWREPKEKNETHQKTILKTLVVANFFKWVDWVGKSKLTGASEYAFPRLSAIADCMYLYIYGNACITHIGDSCRAKEMMMHSLANTRSKKYYSALETKEIADYISNFSYLCFSGVSLGLFFIPSLALGPVAGCACVAYFLFMMVAEVAHVAAEVSNLKNKDIHWLKARAS